MKNALLSALMLATVTAPLAVAPADAQRRDRDYRWHGEDRNWNPSDSYREVAIANVAWAAPTVSIAVRTGAPIAAATTAPPGWWSAASAARCWATCWAAGCSARWRVARAAHCWGARWIAARCAAADRQRTPCESERACRTARPFHV